MKRRICFSVLILLLASQHGWGQIPQTISYQGVLTDAGGDVVPDGNYNLTFRIYDVATGGTALWEEAQLVLATNGIFNAILGSVTPINLAFDKPYWLGVTVGAGSELSPRIELTSSAYSLNARSIVDNAVNSAKVLDNSLTDADINSIAAIAISKISGDVGIEFADIGSSSDIPTTVRNLGSISITAPTSGYVLLFLAGWAVIFGDNTVCEIGFGTTPADLDLHIARVGRLNGSGTERYVRSFSDMVVASVSAGENIFYTNALKESVFSANLVNLGDVYVVGLFVAKRY